MLAEMLSGSAIVHNDSTSALNPYTDEKCTHMSSGTRKGNEVLIRRSADSTAKAELCAKALREIWGGPLVSPYRLRYERRGGGAHVSSMLKTDARSPLTLPSMANFRSITQ
jgi:hypothetical protein